MIMSELTINRQNISNYYDGLYPDITKITWKAGNLNAQVLQRFPNVTAFDCSNGCLVSLAGIQVLTKLKILVCASNRLETLYGIQDLVELEELDCWDNQIRSLAELRNMNLTDLWCSFNKITSLDGLQKSTNLTSLRCNSNRITSLSEISDCSLLHTLSCSDCALTSISPIRGFKFLAVLNCSDNNLRTIESIRDCPNLINLYCGHCELKSIDSVSSCTKLQKLSCSRNELTNLTGVDSCPDLNHLVCWGNQLGTLDGIQSCTRLSHISCSDNNLTSIEPIMMLSRLTEFDCRNNQIVSMEPVVYLSALRKLAYTGNPINIQSIRFDRFVSRLRHTVSQSTVYDNRQSVHDVHVQKSVRVSLIALLSDPKPTFTAGILDQVSSSDLDARAKNLLATYCNDKTIHSDHMITYEELLAYVWTRIIKSEHMAELIKILSQQILDSEGMCFTGRFNRTLSALMGFYSDISIQISDASRIGAIIQVIRTRMIDYDPVKHAHIATTELQDAGYTLDEIKPWIDAISEE